MDFPETLQKVRPEVNCLKCGDQIKLVRREDEIGNVPLQNDAAAIQNGVLVDLFRLFDADGRIVDAFDLAVWALFEHRPDVRASTAAAVQHARILRNLRKLQAPVRERAVADVHHCEHQLPAKALGLAGIFKKRHIFSFFLT